MIKKIAISILVVALIATMGVTAFADGSNSVGPVYTNYGTMYGYNNVYTGFDYKEVRVSTTCTGNAPKVWVQLGIVSYPSGSSIYATTAVETFNTSIASHVASSGSASPITSYSGHQIIGTESWGRFTSVVNA